MFLGELRIKHSMTLDDVLLYYCAHNVSLELL